MTPTASNRLAATLARRDVQALAALVVAQALLVAGYFAATSARPTSLRHVWYPVVWITVGVWAVATRSPPSAGGRRKLLAAVVGVAYLLALAWVGNVVNPAAAGASGGVRVIAASPGWGPTVRYAGPPVSVTAIPFVVIGYVALAYLVYAAALDASGAALSGVLGLSTCVSCSVPLLAALLAGGAGGAATAAYALSLDLATFAYLLSAGALYWGPTIGAALGRLRAS